MSLIILTDGLRLGLIYAIMALGIFISFRILNIPDLTVDGSFTLGMAVFAVFAMDGRPFLGLLLAPLAGLAAGCVTGLLLTKLKVQPILAGILTMTGLYSINLLVMKESPNISLFNSGTVFSLAETILPGFLKPYANFLFPALVLAALTLLLLLFLRTQLGMSLRATGDNEAMVRASSISADRMKILGLALANALVSFSGAMMAQYQEFADISFGIGMVVVGLASIIIGEAFLGRRSIVCNVLAAILGSVLYQIVISLVFSTGLNTLFMKLLSAVILTVALAVPLVKDAVKKGKSGRAAVKRGEPNDA